ncbi:amidohydrolase family protein [Novosphingobium sp.]|uniref:Xaa-Pro dipeptidase n=1 Tax=Novosphingobium sp. TaxID=1874826 RepID=UPI0025FD60AF|nr:amidohydrolase family protein [Novosphingobium sp.]
MKCVRFGGLLALVAGAMLWAAPALADTLYVHAGKLIDPEKGTVQTDRLIRIDDGRITAVTAYAPPPAGAVQIDWSALTVLPGLIDMHTHLSDAEQSNNPAEPLLHSEADIAFLAAKHARDTLAAGFTSVRDVGTFRAFSDVALRKAIDAGLVEGPRMSVAGAYLTVPGGGGEVTGLAADVQVPEIMRMGVVSGSEQMTVKARMMFQRGADFLKLIATGAVLAAGTEPGAPELSEAEMHAAVLEAARNRSYATAHAHGADGIKMAIRAGVRSIEHASLIDDEGIALAKTRGVWLVMDIYNGDWINEAGARDGWPAEILRKNRDTTDAQREGFRKAVKAGVRLAFGTDAGVYPHGLNARQFKYMVRFGMTPMQAIRSATTEAAALMGKSADVGAISPGHFADMIAVAGNPLADIGVLEHVDYVMKGGKVVR